MINPAMAASFKKEKPCPAFALRLQKLIQKVESVKGTNKVPQKELVSQLKVYILRK